MASLVLGTAGAVVGFAIGGPAGAQIGFALGSAAGGILFPPKGPDGPRLNDLSVHASTYGQMIPIPYGTDRIAGNIIWAAPIQEHASEQGGKGGPTYTTYSYTASFASAICEGPIAGILRIWADGLLIYDRRPTAAGEAMGFKASGYKIYLGTEDQLPDPDIQALQGDTPAYRGLAYIRFTDLHLAKFGNRIPSLTFEYVTSGTNFVPQTTSFGEKYDLAIAGSATFGADMDANGHLWLHTMGGHAWVDPDTGKLGINPYLPGVPQIQEYDSATGELLWFYNVPAIYENWSEGSPPQEIYPIGGTGICSGGYYFVGRGYAGFPSKGLSTPGYVHGLAVNMQTHVVESIFNSCSSGQFQNAFYWPAIPVPVIENNKVFFASNTGAEDVIGVGFMPASIAGTGGAPDTDPYPDYDVDPPNWRIPVGWAQARAKGSCPVPPDGEPPKFDGTAIHLPNAAVRSLSIHNPEGAIVQGFNDIGSYVSIVTNSVRVDGFDTSAPNVATYSLPGASTKLPAVVWDATNHILWAFAGVDGNQLFSITPGAGGPVFTGFVLSNSNDSLYGNFVRALTIDTNTGLLRVVQGFGLGKVSLIDPVAGSVVSEAPITLPIEPETGLLWDVPGKNEVIYTNGFRTLRIPFGPTLTANGISVGEIVANVSRRVDLTSDDIDVSELTDQVPGFTITRQMAGRSAIETLMPAYFFDVAEYDWRVKFPKRDRSVSVTIPDEDLAAHVFGSGTPDLVQVKRKQEVDLPQSVAVKFKDIDADYQTGTQYERRMTGRSQSDVTIDLPIAMSAEKAKQVAAAALYSAWAERTGLSFATSLAYARLVPTDVAIVHGRVVRIVHRKRSGGVLEWEAYADGNGIYPSDAISQGGTSAPSGPVGQVIQATPLTKLIVIDAPITQEGTIGPVLTFAVQGQGLGWTGAQIFKSIDGGASYQPIASAPSASLIGTAQDVLSPYQGGNTFDEINTVKVTLLPSSSGATLSSATELAVLNGANAALLGDEVIQYKRAVLNTDGTYTLSGLLRYQRGTDYAVHAAGERFVPLTSSLVQIPMSTSEIGVPRQYKAVSSGGTLSQAQPVTLTYTGADLKPYSPVHIGGGSDADGNLVINWTRRTRIGGEWRDYVEVPLGEASESYEVDIMDASFATVKRTLAGLTSPTAIYSAADQAADGIAPDDPVYVQVYQLSSTVGRGYPGRGALRHTGGIVTGGGSGGGESTGGGGSGGGSGGTGSGTVTPVPTNIANGSTVTLARDTIYQGTLDLSGKTGVSVIAAAGTGTAPTISPGKAITGWTVYSGNIYRAAVDFVPVQLSLNDVPVKQASWPATVPAWATSTAGMPNSDVTGATLYQRNSQYTIVTSMLSNNTVPTDYPFYLEGKLWMLTGANAWAYDSGYLYVWTPDGATPEGRAWAASNQPGINADNSSGVTINGVNVVSASVGISGAGSTNLHIQGGSAKNLSKDGVYASGSTGLVVDGITVINARDTGVNAFYGSNSVTVKNSTISNSGMVGNPSSSMAGIFIGAGSGNLVNSNFVTNSSYIGISVNANTNSTVSNNIVDGFCKQLQDGGGIYTQSVNRASLVLNLTISGNLVKNGTNAQVMGIYLDDGSNGVTVTGNTLTNNTTGLMLHDAFNNTVENNNFTMSLAQHVLFANAGSGNSMTFGNIVKFNTMTLNGNEYAYNLDHGSSFSAWATWDHNTYTSTSPAKFARTWDGSSAGIDYSYTDWKSMIGQESASTMNGV